MGSSDDEPPTKRVRTWARRFETWRSEEEKERQELAAIRNIRVPKTSADIPPGDDESGIHLFSGDHDLKEAYSSTNGQRQPPPAVPLGGDSPLADIYW